MRSVPPKGAAKGKPTGSLRMRMLVSATLVLIIFLGVMGLVLDNAFRSSAEQAVAERLLAHVHMLIAVSEETTDDRGSISLTLPAQLPEPQFNNPGTGLIGLIFDGPGEEIWRSASALEFTVGAREKRQLSKEGATGVLLFDRLPDSADSAAMFCLSYRILWQGESGRSAEFTYVVLQDLVPYGNEVASFRNNLWGWLIAGVVVLIAVQAGIMSWGLRPITNLETDIRAIEAGEQNYLEGNYPGEIEGVTRNLNLLLEAERRQREHYRTTLADLAHSLKTPLAILKAWAARPGSSVEEISHVMDEQLDRMNELVSYQLERAVIHTHSLVRQRTPVTPLLDKLVKTLKQVYRHRNVTIATRSAPASFAGDERDLTELLGNLLDNACKYGRSRVSVEVTGDDDSLHIRVGDDGPGISPEDRELVLQRGIRLDSRQSGQGIGLAVVAELVDRYQGEITIGTSGLGGAEVCVGFGAPQPMLTGV